MKSFYSLFLILPFLMSPSFAKTESDKTIYWTRWDDPPIFVIDGPFRDKGFLDQVEMSIRSKLPGYEHKNIKSNVLRVLKLAEDKANTCNAGWLDTPEWRKVFHLSKPFSLIPSNGIIMKKKHYKEIAHLEPLSLQKMLDETNLKLGVGRLYGKGIDETLQKNNYKKNKKVKQISNSKLVHHMLNADRLDYTLGYPFEAVYYKELFKGKEETIHIPVSENDHYVEVVVACSRTPWGENVIKEVNKLLTQKKIYDEFNVYVDRWLTPTVLEKIKQPREDFYKRMKLEN